MVHRDLPCHIAEDQGPAGACVTCFACSRWSVCCNAPPADSVNAQRLLRLKQPSGRAPHAYVTTTGARRFRRCGTMSIRPQRGRLQGGFRASAAVGACAALSASCCAATTSQCLLRVDRLAEDGRTRASCEMDTKGVSLTCLCQQRTAGSLVCNVGSAVCFVTPLGQSG